MTDQIRDFKELENGEVVSVKRSAIVSVSVGANGGAWVRTRGGDGWELDADDREIRKWWKQEEAK